MCLSLTWATCSKLAFSYVVHHMTGLFEILLHLTFRPYNAYCIYVGSNSNSQVKEGVRLLVQCYKHMYPEAHIFMAKNVNEVKWGEFSLLEADLKCMEQLLALKHQ